MFYNYVAFKFGCGTSQLALSFQCGLLNIEPFQLAFTRIHRFSIAMYQVSKHIHLNVLVLFTLSIRCVFNSCDWLRHNVIVFIMQLLTSICGNCILNGSWMYILPRFSRASLTSLKIAVVIRSAHLPWQQRLLCVALSVILCSGFPGVVLQPTKKKHAGAERNKCPRTKVCSYGIVSMLGDPMKILIWTARIQEPIECVCKLRLLTFTLPETQKLINLKMLKCELLDFIWAVIQEQTFNRYPLPMLTSHFQRFLPSFIVKSQFKPIN